jgi:hypothetical protein
MQELEDSINFSYAMMWRDSETGTVSIIRNKDRPMTYVESKNDDLVFFASEGWMISVALNYTQLSNSFSEVKVLPPYKLIKLNTAYARKLVDSVEREDIAPYIVPATTRHETAYRDDNKYLNSYYPQPVAREQARSASNVVSLGVGVIGWYDRPAGSLDAKSFADITGCTCGFCDSPVEFEDWVSGQAKFIQPESVICASCTIAANTGV